jgi:autotransporter-associated beta strand protein
VAGPTLWDTTTTNWDNAGSLDRYNSGDFANFDDAGLTNLVTLVGTLTPASITLNNSATYTFGGTGRLSGTGNLLMSGAGSLVITNSGSNDFTGTITVSSGLLQVGNGGPSGNLGSGPISNLTAVVFNRTGTNVQNNTFFGTGVVTNKGGGVLVLGGDNSQADMNITVATNSTLRAASATALGRNDGTTLIENGGTLDVNGQNLGPKSVTVSGAGVGGNGAIVNSGAAQISALQEVILQTNTTFGGTGRWDIRAGTAASLDTGGQAYNIIKTGPNQVSLVSITNIDPALADIDIQQGIFSLQNNTGQLGDPTKTISVSNNATLNLFNLNLFPLNKVVNVLNGGTITNESGTSTIIGPVSLTGKATFGVAQASSLIISNLSFAGSLLTNVIKAGAGSLVLLSNSLPSVTVLDLAAGTLDLSRAGTTSLSLATGQSIKGNGALIGSLTAGPASTVSPGASVGILTVRGNVTLGGTNLMEVDRTAGTNDLLRATNTVASSITFGGTLRVVTLAGAITAGNTFKLFSATNYVGSFAAISPATPGPGLGWNTNTLNVDGILRVISTANPTPTNITATFSGNQLNLSWPVDRIGWRLQAQTNPITIGLRSNWVDVPGSTAVNSISVTVNPTNGSVFYRMIYP